MRNYWKDSRHAHAPLHHTSGQMEFLPLHLSPQTGAMPPNPVRISSDQHHSLKKQGRRYTSARNHSRSTSVKYPVARAAARLWISHRHEEHIRMENSDHT